MLFSRRRSGARSDMPHTIAVVRDVVEILAILAAGIWAFYVFAYENRIKPSMAQPDVNVTASLQRLSERNGLIAVGVHLQLRNIGTVKAHFLGIAVNVYGERVMPREPSAQSDRTRTHYDYQAFYQVGARVPVFSYAYVTKLGDPSTGEDAELDPGTTIDNYRTFYVPKGTFDLLTLGIDAPYTKFEDVSMPTHLATSPKGDVRVVTHESDRIQRYNIIPVTSLDIR